MMTGVKKKIISVGAAALLSVSLAAPAFGGQWVQDASRPANQGGVSNWWYRNEDGSYPFGRWEWIDGNGDGAAECYYFSPEGWMYASAVVPGGSDQVDENGAWIERGVVQRKKAEGGQTDSSSGEERQGANGQADESRLGKGWHDIAGGGRRYYTSTGKYATGWKKIEGKKYYFDETGYMLTGYQELEDGTYYFYEDGHMAKGYVHEDGVYYVMDEDGRVIDEVGEEEWTEYRINNGISASASELKGKKYERYEGLNDEMALDCIDLINAERKKAGREPLAVNERLMEAAAIRAQELPDLFSHSRPDSTRCYSVLAEVGYDDYAHAAENIASGQHTPEEVVKAWMNSPGHKANILGKDFTETGIGCYIDSSGYVYWEQMFFNE